MVKKWRFSIFALAIIVLYTGWNWPSASPENVNVHPLVQTFQTDELRTDTWMIHHGASLDRPLSEKRLRRLIQSFRLKEETPFQVTPNIKHSERIYTAEWRRNIFLEIRVIRRGHEKNKVRADYLVVNMKAVGQHAQSLEDAVDYVSTGLEQAGLEPNIHVSIQGATPRMLNRSEQQQFIHRVMHNVNAHEVEALRDTTSTSVSAFSPQLGQPIMSNGREMNVQIALRNDKVHQRTIMTMGTPIITIEY